MSESQEKNKSEGLSSVQSEAQASLENSTTPIGSHAEECKETSVPMETLPTSVEEVESEGEPHSPPSKNDISVSITPIKKSKRIEEHHEGPLSHAVFHISQHIPKVSKDYDTLVEEIKALGGTVHLTLTKNVTHFIATKEDLSPPLLDKVKKIFATRKDIVTISSQFISACKEANAKVNSEPYEMRLDEKDLKEIETEMTSPQRKRSRGSLEPGSEEGEESKETPTPQRRASSRLSIKRGSLLAEESFGGKSTPYHEKMAKRMLEEHTGDTKTDGSTEIEISTITPRGSSDENKENVDASNQPTSVPDESSKHYLQPASMNFIPTE